MAFVVSTPTYVYQSPSGYIFRIRVPNDLKEVVGRCEFRYSLRSRLLRVAKLRARSIAAFVHQLFTRVRNNMEEYTPEQITGLVRHYIKDTLSNDERCRSLDQDTPEGKTMLEASNMGADEAESLLTSVNRWLKNNDHELIYPVTRKLLNNGQEVGYAEDSETFKTLSRELLKGFKDILRVRMERAEGDYSQPDEDLIPALKSETNQSVQMAPTDNTVKASGVKFSEVQAHYVAEAEQGRTWAAKTHREYIAAFELFVRIMGDLDVTTIDRRMMSRYKDTLLKLPPNMNKSAEYRDKTIEEILAMKPEKTRSPKTVNMNTMRISSLFSYAVKNGYMSSNPAADLQIKINKRADQQREAFSSEDLDKLFNSPDYKNGTHKHPYRFWIPLIALHSGCRLEEICQLHLEDIRQEDNVWVFDINDKEGRQLKNRSSVRLVPIHHFLIKLGLLDYADDLREKEGIDMLFPELRNTQQGKYGHYPSRWFATYRKKCGVDGAGKTFHSFRHTFITHLKHKQVDAFMLQELDGHSVAGETMGRYGKRYTPDILLREAIEKIDYELDLSGISWP